MSSAQQKQAPAAPQASPASAVNHREWTGAPRRDARGRHGERPHDRTDPGVLDRVLDPGQGLPSGFEHTDSGNDGESTDSRGMAARNGGIDARRRNHRNVADRAESHGAHRRRAHHRDSRERPCAHHHPPMPAAIPFQVRGQYSIATSLAT